MDNSQIQFEDESSNIQYKVAARISQLVAQLSLEIAQYQAALESTQKKLDSKDKEVKDLKNKTAELQHQLDKLRGCELYGKQSDDFANQQNQRQS